MEHVFSSVVLTQTGCIPHSELTGSHTGSRKQRDPLDLPPALLLSVRCSHVSHFQGECHGAAHSFRDDVTKPWIDCLLDGVARGQKEPI